MRLLVPTIEGCDDVPIDGTAGVPDDEDPRGSSQPIGDVVDVGLDGVEPVPVGHDEKARHDVFAKPQIVVEGHVLLVRSEDEVARLQLTGDVGDCRAHTVPIWRIVPKRPRNDERPKRNRRNRCRYQTGGALGSGPAGGDSPPNTRASGHCGNDGEGRLAPIPKSSNPVPRKIAHHPPPRNFSTTSTRLDGDTAAIQSI